MTLIPQKTRKLVRFWIMCMSLVLPVIPCAALVGAEMTDQLITGKNITNPPLGTLTSVGSLPMNLILNPSGKFAVSTDMGLRQSLWSIRTSDGTAASHFDFPNNPGPQATSNGLYYGLAFKPDGTLYAAQGTNDSVAIFKVSDADGSFTPTGTIKTKTGDDPSGLALDARGIPYVANNDPGSFSNPSSVALYDTATMAEVGRFSFTNSFGGTPNFPLSIASLPNGSRVYVASQRDSAVYVLDATNPHAPALVDTIQTGSHPDALLLTASQNRLFVANGHSDTVSVINTANDQVIATLLLRPDRLHRTAGATPTGLALSQDEKTLYVTLGDMNAVAVVEIEDESLDLAGYIPVGWYPTAVVRSGSDLLVTNAKGTRTRNPDPAYKLSVFEQDPDYIQNIIEGQVSFMAIPSHNQLEEDTHLVLANNGARGDDDNSQGVRSREQKVVGQYRVAGGWNQTRDLHSQREPHL